MAEQELAQALSTLRIKSQFFDYEYFSQGGFRPEDLVNKVFDLTLQPAQSFTSPDQQWDHKTDQLLRAFERLDAELTELGNQVQSKAQLLQDGVAADEAAHLAKITIAERELSALTATLQTLEAKGDAISSFAGRVGARLQSIDAQRQRAVKAAEAFQYLAAFSRCEDLASLPELFHDDSRMEEAAVVAAKLSASVEKTLQSSSTATDIEPPRRIPTGPPPPGTLAAAAEQLELYRNVLDNRIVSRFDLASGAQDFQIMADCARIMAKSGSHGEALLISRYISTRPVFSQQFIMGGLQSSSGGGVAEEAAVADFSGSSPLPKDAAPATDVAAVAAMRALTDLISKLSSTLRDEAVVIEQVFPEPSKALDALTHRIFEQIVQNALETALAPPPADASPEALRSHLRLLTEAYRKTLALAEEAAELAGPGSSLVPSEIADSACGTALTRYMALELAWLGTLGGTKLENTKKTLNRELILDLLSMNEEAVKRCVQVTPPGAAAPAVRLLFHSAAATSALGLKAMPQACLLGQSAAHMLVGLQGASERCLKRLAGAFRPEYGADKDAAASGEAAGSLGTLLQAIAQLADMTGMLRQHYDRVVAAHMLNSPSEAAACVEGLAQLVAALDQRMAAALEKTLGQLFRKVSLTLTAEQAKADFRPAGPAPLDSPTEACSSVVALLRAIGEQATAHMHGSNLSSFLSVFSRRTAATIESHALKFTFSCEGALRWRRDVAEYSSCMIALNARAAGPAFEDLYSLAGLLIVPADSLTGLLDGVGHLDKTRVKAWVERREDWKTTALKVGGGRALLL